MEESDLEDFSKELDQNRGRLSVLLYERQVIRRPRIPLFLVFSKDDALPDCVNQSGQPWAEPTRVSDLLATWPVSAHDHLDRAICLLACIWADIGVVLQGPNGPDLPPVYFLAEDLHQKEYLKHHLMHLEWLEHPSPAESSLRITPKGWARVAELGRTRSALTNPAFVARWFGKSKDGSPDRTQEMQRLVDEIIFPAIQAAGYLATKADTEDYNTGIMDKIHYDIRRAPFVVAEFTNHNLGVYYEAGLAVGHGIPVIPCCPAQDFDKRHFDIAHVNCLVYDRPEDLRSLLERRILGSIGDGPFRGHRG